MKLGFYPGCSPSTERLGNTMNRSRLWPVFGIELVDIDDWNCCGASAAHAVNKDLSLRPSCQDSGSLPKSRGFEEIVVPCAVCFNRLAVAQYGDRKMTTNWKIGGAEHQDDIQQQCKDTNVVQFIENISKINCRKGIPYKFEHQVALLLRLPTGPPHKIIGFDRVEDPTSLDELMQLIGAISGLGIQDRMLRCKSVDCAYRPCCQTVRQYCKDAADRGAEAIIVACPMCHSNWICAVHDRRLCGQEYPHTGYIYHTSYRIGCRYSPEQLGLQRHFVKVNTL